MLCAWVPIFRRNLLLPVLSTGYEIVQASSSEMLVSAYQNIRGHILEVCSFETHKLGAANIGCGNKFCASGCNLFDYTGKR